MINMLQTGRLMFSVLHIPFVIFLVGVWDLGDVGVVRCVPVQGGSRNQWNVDVVVTGLCAVGNVVMQVLVMMFVVMLVDLVKEVAVVTHE